MRRILRTTTAIVACLSLLTPQLAAAQGQGGQPQDQVTVPKPKDQQPKKPKPQGEKQPAAKQQGKPQGAAQKPAAPKPQAQKSSAQKPAPQKQPAAKAQAQKPAQPQMQPHAKKPAGAAAKPQQAQQQKPAQPKPQQTGNAAPKPAAVGANQPQRAQNPNPKPDQKPAAPAAQAQSQKPKPQPQPPKAPQVQAPAAKPDGTPKPPLNAQALRQQIERKEQQQRPAANPAQQAGRDAPPARAPQGGQKPQPAAQPGKQLTADELQNRLRSGKGEASLSPPEAQGKPNDLARRAAQAGKQAPAAALAAGADDGKGVRGKITETKITKDNARRSDQDFRTRVKDGMRDRDEPRDRQRPLTNDELRRDLERREQDLRDQERRADRRDDARDHDDNKNDIAKLLLAGAAGFAVGKIMSDNRQVALNTGDRVVMTLPDGSQQIVRDDNALLYQPGSDVSTETFQDGSTRSTVLRADGSRVVTIRDADMNILRRTLVRADGRETQLINDTVARPVQVATLPAPQQVEYNTRPLPENELRQALLRESAIDRRFTLGQIRDIPEVRALVAPVNVPEITFDSGSAALAAGQAEQLATLGKVIDEAIAKNPNEIFMIEGYTDAVGSTATNLALSDRRAESVALALTEYFHVPPENMVVQGYGEQFPLVASQTDERDNRRVAVRRITDLLEQS